jgi:hypothetical protein
MGCDHSLGRKDIYFKIFFTISVVVTNNIIILSLIIFCLN